MNLNVFQMIFQCFYLRFFEYVFQYLPMISK